MASNPMSRLRTVVAVLILGILAALGVRLAPVYMDNMRLQSYVEGMAHNAETQTRPDEDLRVAVLEKAAALGLPIKADNVHIKRSGDGTRIDVRYIVRVDFPLYTVDLHFYPGSH